MYHPPRGGVRGGQDQFSWDSVKNDKHRENYLGHSLMAPVGRWQKGKDLSWYSKERTGNDSVQLERLNELAAVKRAEEEAMLIALGHKVAKKEGQALTNKEMADALKRNQGEGGNANIGRVEGVGSRSARSAILTNNGKQKETEGRTMAESLLVKNERVSSTLLKNEEEFLNRNQKTLKKHKKRRKHKSDSDSDDERKHNLKLHRTDSRDNHRENRNHYYDCKYEFSNRDQTDGKSRHTKMKISSHQYDSESDELSLDDKSTKIRQQYIVGNALNSYENKLSRKNRHHNQLSHDKIRRKHRHMSSSNSDSDNNYDVKKRMVSNNEKHLHIKRSVINSNNTSSSGKKNTSHLHKKRHDTSDSD